jgi:hypothetical protein
MGRKTGDKGRYHRARRKKLARRVKMRELFGKAAPKKGTGESLPEAAKVPAESAASD